MATESDHNRENPPRSDETLSLEALERINQICLEVEDALKKGESPRIEDYLGDVDGTERSQLLRNLVHLELDYNKVDRSVGLNVTFVTTAGNDEQAFYLLRELGMPFRRPSD